MKTMQIPEKLTGYTGKILRLNLSDSSVQIVPTTNYVPEYLGGMSVANKIFWDEVKPGVKAFDPENKIIFMTGPGSGTGMPLSGRCSVCGISPNALPEQYNHSNICGYFGGMLKFAGYDGLIIEGKAPKHTYVHIEDDKVEFLDADADGLWGQFVHETQEMIFNKFGRETHALVIGPAGENLHRNASIATTNDSVSAKSGFGAVWGSKNLKAICVHGTGTVPVSDPLEILQMRKWLGNPAMTNNPVVPDRNFGTFFGGYTELPGWADRAKVCNSFGCNQACIPCYFNTDSPFEDGKKVSQEAKCMEMFAVGYQYDCGYGNGFFIHSKRQERPGENEGKVGNYAYTATPQVDKEDPDLPFLLESYPGDSMGLWKPNIPVASAVCYMCIEYGLDKWDLILWYMTWLAMCQKEGLLDDLDFEMEVDLGSIDFMKHFMHMMVYREGKMGDALAEGMARFIRFLGKEKYGDTIYKGRTNSVTGEQLDIPVSFESAWGHCAHWQGRGYQGCPKPWWLVYNLGGMVDSRDAANPSHFHAWADEYRKSFMDDPAHSPELVRFAIKNREWLHLKESLLSCEWKTPDVGHPNMERDMFRAATGVQNMEEEDLLEVAEKSNLLYRAILMRNFDRTRDMEVAEMYPWMTYPDPNGETVTWDEWNDLVDLFYKEHGWDLETGWPYRSTWEKYGLKEIADEMEKLGKLPPEGRTEYTRKPNPIGR